MSWLPVAPFREWLLRQPGNVSELSERLGVAERVLYRWLKESDNIQLETVDAALTHAGAHLRDVYPALYEPKHYDLKPLTTLMQPDLLVRARGLYDLGMSVQEVAEETHLGSGYATVRSLSLSLQREFRHQGWRLRRRSDAMSLVMSGGWLPPVRCRAVSKRGEQCRRAPMRNSAFCHSHDPTTRDEAVRFTLAARERSQAGLVPSGPFVAWLAARTQELGSCAAVARRLGMHRQAVARYLAGRLGLVRRDTVERCLGEFGDDVSDLYSEKLAA